MAAAAARARVTGTLIKKGAEGPPPLPSSPGSQIFVVGGGARELVVLVVVSGEHGGNSGQGGGWSPTQIWGFLRSSYCFLYHTSAASPSDSPASSLKHACLPPSGRLFPKAQR